MSRMSAIGRSCLAACAAALWLTAPATAHASGFNVLYTFMDGRDSNWPWGAIPDNAGNVYGETWGDVVSRGAVFKVAPDGTETTLHAFRGSPHGTEPAGGLLRNTAGDLFGTTIFGGIRGACYPKTRGCGVVFEIPANGKEKILYSFGQRKHGADGVNPWGGVIADSAGNLYGTTSGGGQYHGGTVFKLAPDGTETVLYSFCSLQQCADGDAPLTGVVADKAGNLYGTTLYGGTGFECSEACGTVFKLAPDGTFTVLHSFTTGTIDGAYPGGVILDHAGNLYGATEEGGDNNLGAVYKITPDGTETVLHSFGYGGDGKAPSYYAALVADGRGNLYGTTGSGGTSTVCGGSAGCGTVFKVAPDGTEIVLHSFNGTTDGSYPQGPLSLRKGTLYGAATAGGNSDGSGYGTVFAVSP